MSSTDHGRNGTGSGFRQQYAATKNQRRKAVIGSRNDSSLKAHEPLRHLFVYRLDKSTTQEELKNYLVQSVRVVECERISHSDALNASFKVAVPFSDAQKMLSSDFWPCGVCCRFYVPPRKSVSS